MSNNSNERDICFSVVNKLRAFAQARHLSQKRMATRIGISQGALCRILSGETQRIRASTLRQIASALEQSLEKLLDPTVPPPTPAPPSDHEFRFDVFLSHSRKDNGIVRDLARALQGQGVKCWFDEDELRPGMSWQIALENGMRDSRAIAILVGPDGIGPWEDQEVRYLLALAGSEGKNLLPVRLPGTRCEPELPTFLRERTWVDLRSGLMKEGLARFLWGITGRKTALRSGVGAPKVAPTRLRHGAEHLVGRERELARLDAAWHDSATHVVTIVAWGGVGKTALVAEWMARMARDDWRGAEQVFDWSFYSQGTREQGAASTDTFMAKALEFLGDPGMAGSAASPWDKGARLAQLVAQKRSLLVLDGIEPLQYPPGPMGGKLRDPAPEALLKGLAQHNPGLCIVTTRESVADLKAFRDTTAPEWALEHLSEEAGAQLLFQAGVRRAGHARIEADDPELKRAAGEVGGHALTLCLLGNYLRLAYDGNIRKRSIVEFTRAEAEFRTNAGDDRSYGHAFKVMADWEEWLAGASRDGQRQLAVLQLLGLFDRPADACCLSALRTKPAIGTLTESLVDLTEAEWSTAVSRLEECGIVSRTRHDREQNSLNAHPLVREYFAKQVREAKPLAWREAHGRLYEYLKGSAPDTLEPTLEDLLPMYQAVVHACQAGRHSEGLRLYDERIRMGERCYSWKQLGAVATDLSIMQCFFDHPWTSPVKSLSEDEIRKVLYLSGSYLWKLGRASEAIVPMEAGLKENIKCHDLLHASRAAGDLCELYAAVGDLEKAKSLAGQATKLAEGSGDAFERRRQLCKKAAVFHEAGLFSEAERLFHEAEESQRTGREAPLYLYSDLGFKYCSLLLDFGRFEEVEKRASFALDRANQDRLSLRTIAADNLSLGRAIMLRQRVQGCADPERARARLNEAIDGLSRAGHHTYLVRAYLARAELYYYTGESQLSRDDLKAAMDIVERGGMALYRADCLLMAARLSHEKTLLADVRRLVEQCGYHRWDRELAAMEETAAGW